MISKSVLILCLHLALSHGLTEDDIDYFGNTGLVESNTGLVGNVTVTSSDDDWLIESNNIPDHVTGTFPGRGNPNGIEVQEFAFSVTKNPQVADESTCLPPGPIGIAVNGIVMYNPWDADHENAVEGDGAEVFDSCDGHPDGRGRYHYHRQPSSCLFTVTEGEPSPLIGVAFDGFAIYGPVDESGNTLTSDDLDECHGRYNSDGVYQYHTTSDFPYILGCYKGTPQGVRTGSHNCFKASEADTFGNVGNAYIDIDPTTLATTTKTPNPTTTETPAPSTTRSRRSRNRTRRPRRNRGSRTRSDRSHPRMPRNILQRKMPASYWDSFPQLLLAGEK